MSLLSKFYKWVSCKHGVRLREENNRLREQITVLKARHDVYVVNVANLSSKYQTLRKKASELERTYVTLIAMCDAEINNTNG